MRVLDENKESEFREQLLPWLIGESVDYLLKQDQIKNGCDKLFSIPSEILLTKHQIFLKKEEDRLKKIEDDKVKKAERKAIKRAEKKEHRRLTRMSKEKTDLYTAIEREIINRTRSDNIDPFNTRIVDFDGNDVPGEFV